MGDPGEQFERLGRSGVSYFRSTPFESVEWHCLDSDPRRSSYRLRGNAGQAESVENCRPRFRNILAYGAQNLIRSLTPYPKGSMQPTSLVGRDFQDFLIALGTP
jgi:hypothetical protein